MKFTLITALLIGSQAIKLDSESVHPSTKKTEPTQQVLQVSAPDFDGDSDESLVEIDESDDVNMEDLSDAEKIEYGNAEEVELEDTNEVEIEEAEEEERESTATAAKIEVDENVELDDSEAAGADDQE